MTRFKIIISSHINIYIRKYISLDFLQNAFSSKIHYLYDNLMRISILIYFDNLRSFYNTKQ